MIHIFGYRCDTCKEFWEEVHKDSKPKSLKHNPKHDIKMIGAYLHSRED